MNRITSMLIILICALLLGAGVFWYATKPIAITGYVPPSGGEPSLSGLPTTTPQQVRPAPSNAAADTRSWGDRLRDKIITQVPGVIWQTYTNKEYGFEMEYPDVWAIKMSKHPDSFHFFGKDRYPDAINSFAFYSKKDKSPYSITFVLNIYPQTLREFARQSPDLDRRFKNQDMIPDAMINGIDIFIENGGGDGRSDQTIISAYLEKDGYTYTFGGSFEWQNEYVNKIIEHMIKTFHFLQ